MEKNIISRERIANLNTINKSFNECRMIMEKIKFIKFININPASTKLMNQTFEL